MVELLSGDPQEYQAGGGAQVPPIDSGLPGLKIPQISEPAAAGVDAYHQLADSLANAYANIKTRPMDDRITSILKNRPELSRGQQFEDLSRAIQSSFASISTTGDRKYIPVGEALNMFRAQRIKEAEDIARVQIQDEQLANQTKHQAVQMILDAAKSAEAARHNRAIEAKKSDFDKKIEALSQDLPPEIARGIAAGRYVVTKDMGGMPTGIVDIGTGRNVWAIGERIPASPATTPTTAEPDDYRQGTGASGFLGNIANTVTDALGFGLAAPQTEKASQALKTLQERTGIYLAAAVPGRESNQVRERLRTLTVTPGSLFQGDARAAERLRQTRDFIAEEVARLETTVLSNPGSYKPQEISNTRVNIGQLQGLLATYDKIIGKFKASGGGGDKLPEVTGNDDPAYKALKPGDRYIYKGDTKVKK